MKTGVDLIQVSLHGLGSFHNSLLGIKDAYEKVRNRIIELMEKLNIATNTVITPYNMESIKPLVEDLVRIQKITDKKFSYVRFIPVLPSGRGYTLYKTTSPFIEKVESLLSRLIEKYDLNFEVPILHPNPYEYFYEGGRWFCPAGSTVAVVRIDGCIIPCNQFLDTNVRSKSSVFDTDFHRIWINDPLLSEMRKGIAGSPNFSCQECRYLIMRTQLL
jgi:radical SAM protein with 4Fe4S-binding SPASM domain